MKAVNWNRPDDSFTETFWRQNIMQFWTEEEIPLSDDLVVWNVLSNPEKEVYKKVLGGLTRLDTEQGGVGMPLISQHVESEQRKAVLGFMGAMEHVHARSYSYIFTTLASIGEIDQIFEWVDSSLILQRKVGIISKYYKNIKDKRSLYMAMVASVFLESFLFYSGFFYPLFLAGQGKMVASGEIINLILRDESIHGLYVGILAQEIYQELTPEQKESVDREVKTLLDELMDNEIKYTEELYSKIGLVDDVKVFIQYNANKALLNLGREEVYAVSQDDVNPIVLNGLSTETKNHDFFSTKGNGYIRTLNVEELTDEDFIFDF